MRPRNSRAAIDSDEDDLVEWLNDEFSKVEDVSKQDVVRRFLSNILEFLDDSELARVVGIFGLPRTIPQ